MNRRKFVKNAAVSIAAVTSTISGCSMNETEDRTVENVTANTDSTDLLGTSSVLTADITPQSQGQIELGLEYDGEGTAQYYFGNTVPVASPILSDTPEGLILAEIHTDFVREDQNSWIIQDQGFYATLELQSQEFSPEESVSTAYNIWGHPDYFETIETGQYRFETSISKFDQTTIEYTVEVEIS
jgi:hypothetical protein